MKLRKSTLRLAQILLAATLAIIPTSLYVTASAQSPPNIGVNSSLSVDKVPRGRPIQAVVVMDIPSGFHVNSSKPLGKFLIPTNLQIEAPTGIRVGRVIYPRALLRSFRFSKNKVSVYEGRATMRFKVTVPANFASDSAELKARLRYQSCNDEVCFPPQTHELTLPINLREQ
jgi:DsbC/DsbD-like thiol-disulfide interchange protein